MVKNDIDVQEQHEQLPSFYWLPKLYKKPYGSRFIAASRFAALCLFVCVV